MTAAPPILGLEELLTRTYESKFPRESVQHIEVLEHAPLRRTERVLVHVIAARADRPGVCHELVTATVLDGERAYLTRYHADELDALTRGAAHVRDAWLATRRARDDRRRRAECDGANPEAEGA